MSHITMALSVGPSNIKLSSDTGGRLLSSICTSCDSLCPTLSGVASSANSSTPPSSTVNVPSPVRKAASNPMVVGPTGAGMEIDTPTGEAVSIHIPASPSSVCGLLSRSSRIMSLASPRIPGETAGSSISISFGSSWLIKSDTNTNTSLSEGILIAPPWPKVLAS